MLWIAHVRKLGSLRNYNRDNSENLTSSRLFQLEPFVKRHANFPKITRKKNVVVFFRKARAMKLSETSIFIGL